MDKMHAGRPFKFTDQYRELRHVGYTETWRHCNHEGREYSWYGRGRAFRIDHAFASPPLLERLHGCVYSHHERETGVSDHSMLIVDIEDAG